MMYATLKTKRLILREPCAGDVGRIGELMNNWNVVRVLAKVPYPYGRADAENFVSRNQARETSSSSVVYAITIDDGLVGIISVQEQTLGPNLGYWLGEPYWGRGLMTEAVAAVIAEFFRQPNNQKLTSGVFCGNDASIAIQRKFGFEVVGESSMMCVARGEAVQNVKTELTRQKFKELQS